MRRAAIAVLLAASCSIRSPAPVVHQYRLDHPSPELEARSLPVVVRVALLDVADMYNRETIVFREGPHEMGTYGTHRWLTTPPRMLTHLLARDMVASGLYEAVVEGPAPLLPDYEVGGTIERIEEEVLPDGCAAVLDVRILLIRSGAGAEPLFQRRYASSTPCGQRGAPGFVAAMSEAAAGLSAEIQRDVYAAIAGDLRRGEVASE